MIVKHALDIPAAAVGDGAEGVTIRWLIAGDDGAPNFYMRLFEIEPGGHTPHHTHEWEHEVYLLEGDGAVMTADGPCPIGAGDVVFMPPDELHSFENTGNGVLRMLCLVPART